MKVTANVSFSGRISMFKGEKRDIADEELLKDLLAAGYVKETAPAQKGKVDPQEPQEGAPKNEGK